MKTTFKPIFKTLTTVFGGLLLAILLVPNAMAQCGGMPTPKAIHASWHPLLDQGRLLRAGLVLTNETTNWGGDGAVIVGMWHVKFVTKDSPGIPDGTEIDAGYSIWHSDGTEIMNSGGRSPLTSNFCLGVWKQVGVATFKLNHFATGWDATGSTLIGPAQIREEVTVDHNGHFFSGYFTIDQFDESGNTRQHAQGTITGSRITVDSGESPVF